MSLLMRRKFILPIRGLSINSTYTRDFGMTSSAREWFATVEHLLSKPENRKALEELRSTFNPLTSAYEFKIKAFIPREFYYTKEGKISKRSLDCSNYEKSILDVFCLEKYPNSLQTDDCVVKSLTSTKLPSSDDKWKIEIVIKIVSNS